jgi:tetratricopeptide (TPR) repeat protein
MSQRLSRKEIKRDEFMESVGGAFEYAQQHSRSLIGIALAILAAIIVLGLVLGYRQEQTARADRALAEALRAYQAVIDPLTADPTDPRSPSFTSAEERSQAAAELLRGVRQDYARSDAARVAAAYLGRIAMEDGDFGQARSLWEEAVPKASDDMLAAEVRVNLMSLDRAEGKGDELVTRLRAMLSGPDEGLPHDLLWYQLAITLESLGRESEATEAYKRIVEDYPRSAYAPEARQRSGGSQISLFGS